MSSHYVPNARLRTLVFPTTGEASRHVALMIESLIRQNNSAGRPTVLGLPTGSTPVGLYRELIRLHKEDGPRLLRASSRSTSTNTTRCRRTTRTATTAGCTRRSSTTSTSQPQNIHIPDGTVAAGGRRGLLPPLRAADPQGRRHRPADPGHRPHRAHRLQRAGLDAATAARGMVTLDPVTRRDAASDFFGEENVPHQAITMGVGTILEARKIVLMAFGEHKAPIVQQGRRGRRRPKPSPPASCSSTPTPRSCSTRRPPAS